MVTARTISTTNSLVSQILQPVAEHHLKALRTTLQETELSQPIRSLPQLPTRPILSTSTPKQQVVEQLQTIRMITMETSQMMEQRVIRMTIKTASFKRVTQVAR